MATESELVLLAQAKRVIAQGDPNAVLVPSEVAALFRVDPKTVSRWAEKGRIKSFRTPGNHRRFRVGDVLFALSKM